MKFRIVKDTRAIIGGISVNIKHGGTVLESDDHLDKMNSMFKEVDEKNPKIAKRFSDINR